MWRDSPCAYKLPRPRASASASPPPFSLSSRWRRPTDGLPILLLFLPPSSLYSPGYRSWSTYPGQDHIWRPSGRWLGRVPRGACGARVGEERRSMDQATVLSICLGWWSPSRSVPFKLWLPSPPAKSHVFFFLNRGRGLEGPRCCINLCRWYKLHKRPQKKKGLQHDLANLQRRP